MSHIYIVSVRYDYEGESIDSAWSSQERALKRQEILKSQKYGDSVHILVLPIDNKNLLSNDSHLVWEQQYLS